MTKLEILLTNLDSFVTTEWRIWLQRLGAEAEAGAIADMLWKSRRRTNYGSLFWATWFNKFAWIWRLLGTLNFFRLLDAATSWDATVFCEEQPTYFNGFNCLWLLYRILMAKDSECVLWLIFISEFSAT